MKKIFFLIVAVFLCMTGCVEAPENHPVTGSCEFVIRCETILKNTDKIKAEKKEFVPDSGIIVEKTKTDITDETTPFSLLTDICKSDGIKVEFAKNTAMDAVYVTAINNISSGDVGEMSGWLYYINGESASEAANVYKVKDGDLIEWIYTCDMGNDI